MLKQAGTIFTPPLFPGDEDKTRKARYAHVIALAFLSLVIGFEAVVRLFAGYTSVNYFDAILSGVALICAGCLVLLQKGHVRFTSFLLVALLWLASNGTAATGFGARDASFLINFAIILMAGLLLGWQASLAVTLLSILSGFALAYAEQNKLIGTTAYPITSFARDITFIFGLNGILIYLLINGLENALRRSRVHLAQLEAVNVNLSQTQNELQDRSTELLTANQQLENRTRKLQAVVTVTRVAGSIQELDRLLESITGTISRQLGYDYVGLYLLDERREFALLCSTNLENGQQTPMGDRVSVRDSGPLGFVLQTGQARVLRSADEAARFLSQPGRPAARCALLLPLKYAGQTIGALDLRSAADTTFSEDDISVLGILADQVAITIQNLLLHEQSQVALRKADLASIQASAQAWKSYGKAVDTKAYRYDGIKSEPVKSASHVENGNNSLLIPVQLRGQTIGSFRLRPSDSSRAWTDDELAMARATAERVALALEGARLLEQAQKRATREAFLSEVASKLSSSFQLDSILRDTIQELGQTLRNSTVTFQLVNPAGSVIEQAGEESVRHNGTGAADE